MEGQFRHGPPHRGDLSEIGSDSRALSVHTGASGQTRRGTGLAEHGSGAPVEEGLIDAWNESSRPFVWVKSAEQILATMHRPFKKTVH